MAEYPYALSPAKIPQFLGDLRAGGTPGRVTQKHVEKMGYKSTNDRALVAVLKFIGLISETGAPTPAWQEFRSTTNGRQVVARLIRAAYADLFTTYPDAPKKDAEVLRDYFSAETKVGIRAVGAMVATFKHLCAAADFGAGGAIEAVSDSGSQTQEARAPEHVPRIQLATPDGLEQYKSEGVLIHIRPTRQTIAKARKFLDVVEISLEEEKDPKAT